MNIFKNRTIGFWIGLSSSIIMLISSIAFIIYDYGDRTYSHFTVLLIILGVLFELAIVFKNNIFLPMLPSIFFGAALSIHLYLGLPTLSDIVNGVNFIGGNASAVIIFGGLFIVGTIGALVSSFMKQTKEDNKIISSPI